MIDAFFIFFNFLLLRFENFILQKQIKRELNNNVRKDTYISINYALCRYSRLILIKMHGILLFRVCSKTI